MMCAVLRLTQTDTGFPDPSALTLETLRSWLWSLAARNAARSTIARHAAAARTFTAWLMSTGASASIRGSGSHLEDPARVADGAAPRADGAGPSTLLRRRFTLDTDMGPKDLAFAFVMQLSWNFSTPLQCESASFAIGSAGRGLRATNHSGTWQGDKRRVVPFGAPAQACLDGWLTHGRPILATTEKVTTPCFLEPGVGDLISVLQCRAVSVATQGD